MHVNLKLQAERDMTLPPLPAKVFTGSALPFEIEVPDCLAGGTVTALSVAVTNANGVVATGTCTKVGGLWMVLFAATNFANYGFVEKGVKYTATVKRSDDSTASVVLAVGDLDIVAATASATPGTASTFYVVKGDRVFVRSTKVGDVQHYVEQTMEYDAAIGWGANWSGDYILNNAGEFVEYEEAS